MKEQCVVVENYPNNFQQKVEERLKDRWRVVPGTVAISMGTCICFMEREHVGPVQVPKKPS